MNVGIFLTCMVVPVLLLIIGGITKVRPKKEINGTLGYRSKRSRSSQEMWDKAQQLMAKYMLIIGVILLAVSAAAGVFISRMADVNGMIIGICILSVVQVAGTVSFIPLVESKLK